MKTRAKPVLARGAMLSLMAASLFLVGCEDKADKNKSEKPMDIKVDRSVYNWPPASETPVELAPSESRMAKNFYVILDGSGSMDASECSGGKTKAQAAVASLLKFESAVPENAHLGLFIFDNTGASERVPLGPRNSERFQKALVQMQVGGGTPLGSAMAAGLKALEAQARAQLGYGEYNLVIVTDGEANDGEEPDPMVRTLVSKTPVVIHTVGFCIGENHALNQPGLTVYKAADNPQQLMSGLEEVLAESETFDVAEFK